MNKLRPYLVVIAVGIFVTSLVQPDVLALLPFRFILKNHLSLSPQTMATFFAVAAVPWYGKPLAGLVIDSIPFLGTRRRHYLLFSSIGAGILWGVLGLVPQTFSWLLTIILALNILLVGASTVLGGLLVEEGQRHAATGRLSTIRVLVTAVSIVIAGALGGFLATRPLLLTSAIGGGLLALLAVTAFALLREPVGQKPTAPWQSVVEEFRRVMRSQPFWVVAGLLFLVMIAPGFVTPLFYYQTTVLKFSPQFLGTLKIVTGLFGLAGGVAYFFLCKRIPVRRLLLPTIAMHIVVTICFVAYRTPGAALMIEGANGLTLALAILPLFDVAARATPHHSASLGYAVLVSVLNVASSLSDVLGSWLFGHYHISFLHLVWLNAATTALVLPALRLLPVSMINQPDSQSPIF